jgi:hypothetical protein
MGSKAHAKTSAMNGSKNTSKILYTSSDKEENSSDGNNSVHISNIEFI